MTTVLPSIYRAKATQVNGNRLMVLVPQVFGEAAIEVTNFLAPPTIGMGWVFFQGGNPEFPVWMTRLSGDGSSADFSEEITGLQQEDAELAARLVILESGGGAGDDEVWVGPNAPIGTQELWYDTDAPNPPSGTGVLHAKVAGSWLPIAISGTVIHPAYAGLVSDSPTWARFGNVNHSGGMGEPGYRIDPTGEMQIAFGSGKALGVYEAIAPSWNPVISVTGGTVRINKRIESGVAAGSEAMTFTDGNYLAWWNGGTRLGYLQYNTGDVIVNAEGRQLKLHGNGIELAARGGNVSILGNDSLYWPTWGGGWYMQDYDWVRATNNKSIYTGASIRGDNRVQAGSGFTWVNDADSGLIYHNDGLWSLYCNNQSIVRVNSACIGIRGAEGKVLRLYTEDDGNHQLGHWASTSPSQVHPSSGINSNGPRLSGYSTVVLTTSINGINFLFEYGGSAFAHAAWNVFSSRRAKRSITPISLTECLDDVIRWKPVTYTGLGDDIVRDGFVAEEMNDVTPTIVDVAREIPEQPNETDEQRATREQQNASIEVGTPTAIDYGKAVVRLTGAVQALLARIEQLESRIITLEGAPA